MGVLASSFIFECEVVSPCMVTLKTFALHLNIFVLSDLTPDVVLSGMVSPFVKSFGSIISILLGCAIRAPA